MEVKEETILARSVFSVTYEELLDLFRAARRRWRVVLYCVLYGLLILGFAVFIIVKLQSLDSVFSLSIEIVGMLLSIFLLVWFLLAPRRAAKRRMRQLSEAYSVIPKSIVELTNNDIAVKDETDEHGMRFSYASIKKCIETRDRFVFLTREGQLFTVDKQGLEITDVPGFRNLIREKCPNANRK